MSNEQEPMLPPSSEAVDAAMTAAYVANRLTRGEKWHEHKVTKQDGRQP